MNFLVPDTTPPFDGDPDQQAVSDRDQTSADTEQTGADLDQTVADRDQASSDRDQAASDSDQRSADFDQAASEDTEHSSAEVHDQTRRARARATLERDISSQARADTGAVRDATARRRDQAAADRDLAAAARDRLAATLDMEIERLEEGGGRDRTGLDVLLRAADDRRRAAMSRARAAVQRDSAARDRHQAAADRDSAAGDRRAASQELAMEGVDHLTGALRRRVGLAAIEREMNRSRRGGEGLVLAFVDVDGLKAVNDAQGHAAGDELLREVVQSIQRALRAYDVVLRYGGDEFVCALLGDLPGVRTRFAEIATRLAEVVRGATITTGLAQMRPEDSLSDLLGRADAAMMASRRPFLPAG
jgi:diguanylate cyclase (GGDEF)-like protein